MPKIISTIGVSSSGKTSWAEKVMKLSFNSIVNLNRDDFRFGLFNNGIRDWAKYKFTKGNEKRVTEVIEQHAYSAVIENKDILISDTNLNPSTRQKWKDFAKKHNYEYEEKLFPCDWKELVKRNAQRQGGLSESILWSQYLSYMRQFGYYGELKVEQYQDNPTLPDTVWVDIDGTIAEMTNRKPFEWGKVGQDLPRTEIIKMVEALGKTAHHVTFMSGRDEICYNETWNWIKEVVDDRLFSWDLYMRKEGDTRRDDIVKYEMYLKHIAGKKNVLVVFDDRPQVIRMQTVVGFPNIINVGEYGKEF